MVSPGENADLHSDPDTLRFVLGNAAVQGKWRGLNIIHSVSLGPVHLHHLKLADAKFASNMDAPRKKGDFTPEFNFYIVMVVKGNISVQTGTSFFSFSPNTIFGIRSWAPFALNSGADAELVIAQLPAWFAILEVLGESSSVDDHVIPANFFCAPAILALSLKLMEQEIPSDVGQSYFAIVASMLMKSFELNLASAKTFPKPMGRMGRLLTIILKNFHEEGFSPRIAASELRCSVRTIHSLCAEHNTTFSNLLMDTRLRIAANNIINSKQRISDVAFSSGFVSFSHFCRAFKDYFGMSAGRYRAEGGRDASRLDADPAGIVPQAKREP
jgi:AraC-like DNA-binding protein